MLTNKIMKIVPLCTAFLLLVACLTYARTDHREYKDSKLSACQDCHTGAGDISNHGGYREHRLLAQRAETNCLDCHQQSTCFDCHNGGNIEAYKEKSLSRDGESMPTTHGADFISTHSIKAVDNSQGCYRCHESSFCSDCHNAIQNKGSMVIKNHSATGNTQQYFLNGASSAAQIAAHAADARKNLQSCQGCHPDATECKGCHNLSNGGKVYRQH